MTTKHSLAIRHPRTHASALTSIIPLIALSVSFASNAQKPADAPASESDAQKSTLKQLKTAEEIRNEELEAKLASARADLERLKLESDLLAQKLAQSLQQVLAEKAKLEADLALLMAKENSASAPERTKLDALQRSQKLREAQLGDELSGLATEQVRTKQALDVDAVKLQAELSWSRAEIERTRTAEDVLDMKSKTKIAGLRREQEQLAAENSLVAEKRRAEQAKLADEQVRSAAVAQTFSAQIQTREFEEKWRDAVNTPVVYTAEPFKDGILTVSDRKIDLNGPIISGTADYVCDRIDYFNNQDRTRPIFVVITNSPGGSVQQGYRILKAIETSDAPIPVVVKSFAASMAATIATLAPHSYAFPNAIILHHQMSGNAAGNMTNMEQEVATMQEWEKRLAEPIAKKMGVSLQKFKDMMYAAKKSGDWDEFADKALQLKWIDHLVNEIREEGVRKKPTDTNSGGWWMSSQKRDENGVPFVSLPALEPYDCYFMINPRGFYRVDGR